MRARILALAVLLSSVTFASLSSCGGDEADGKDASVVSKSDATVAGKDAGGTAGQDAGGSAGLDASTTLPTPDTGTAQGRDATVTMPADATTIEPRDASAGQPDTGLTPAGFAGMLQQGACTQTAYCCGAADTVTVSTFMGGCSPGDWASVAAELEAAATVATWDGAAATLCYQSVRTSMLNLGCTVGPPLANATKAEIIVHLRNSAFASCDEFLVGSKAAGTDCASHYECQAGLICGLDKTPSLCEAPRGAGQSCGAAVYCATPGLYCDATSGTCSALVADGAACTTPTQCADALCDGAPMVCRAGCRK